MEGGEENLHQLEGGEENLQEQSLVLQRLAPAKKPYLQALKSSWHQCEA